MKDNKAEFNFRTDLALERRDIYKQNNKLNEINGI